MHSNVFEEVHYPQRNCKFMRTKKNIKYLHEDSPFHLCEYLSMALITHIFPFIYSTWETKTYIIIFLMSDLNHTWWICMWIIVPLNKIQVLVIDKVHKNTLWSIMIIQDKNLFPKQSIPEWKNQCYLTNRNWFFFFYIYNHCYMFSVENLENKNKE